MMRKTPHKIPHLPQEIITDILLRLPVRSLLRFKFTSKSWRSLISSKHFVKAHLENSKKNPSLAHHRIISVNTEGNEYDIQHYSSYPLFPERVSYASSGDFPVEESVNSLDLVDSSNGLICIRINSNKYFLWNPSTRESKKLPDFDANMLSRDPTEEGFGFDESSGDYKVFAVSYNDDRQIIAKIYSLKQNFWRRINYINDKDFKPSSRTGKFMSGNLHWIKVIEPEWWRRWYISSLDLKNGANGIVEQPSHGYHIDLWVLKQYGAEDSWCKMMRISHNSLREYRNLTPLDIISQNREVLFSWRWGPVVYKSKENRFCYLETYGFNNLNKLVHVESLVSIVADVEE
ncbi:hypothetical protein CDL12_10610 [Handroanthus impetiginosus]|uniref:F-box domain-containing protein n=1 Tax=Handroanthus impetiginosus TaxID=429701 RepID=A0A2G9HGV6_9LAMI|nr:hypothetical protein CDL12_10610 [Handroanthus impetiginosus]